MSVAPRSYFNDVIGPGDTLSGFARRAGDKANQEHSLAAKVGLLDGNRLLVPERGVITRRESKKESSGFEIQTDGVGTKVRIYMKAFNSLYEKYRADKTDANKKEFEETAKILFYRMFLDLYAMNVDDFRDGDIALVMSDILEVDFVRLDGDDKEQGEVFCNAFAFGISEVVNKTGIALGTGESALMGDGDKLKSTRRNYGAVVDGVLGLKETSAKITSTGELPADVELVIVTVRKLLAEAAAAKANQAVIDRSVEISSLGGATIGFRKSEKLSALSAGQVVIAIFEQPTEKGIIGPRANGISAIRKTMENLLGEDWPMKTLQDYFDALSTGGIDIDDAVRTRLSKMGLDTPLWDIATGETTVFNPVVAGTLLGGLAGEPMAHISRLIHNTGNPKGKLSDAVAGTEFGINIDYSKVTLPQIMEMCLIADQENFAAGMEKFNMGIPYAIACDPEDVHEILCELREQQYPCDEVGIITEGDGKPMIRIQYPDGTSFHEEVKKVRK